jgi:NADPH:quinone reductase-like Zn-dependent oxidoreductase
MTTSRRDERAAHGAVGAPRMTAVVQDRYGSDPADVLRLAEVDRPQVADDRVLVRVHAASVDRGTWHIMAGLPYPIRAAGFGLRRPRYLNPGRSLAGTVDVVGRAVTGLAVGDEVFGVGEATLAPYAAARPSTLSWKPDNLSFEQAAAVPVSGLTALQAVRDRARVTTGETVLVLGASGGVGTFAVQIAKAAGAEVTGVCSPGKVAMVSALGADHVVDYTAERLTDRGQRFDVIVDTGGNTPVAHLRRALTPRGRLVVVGGETDGRLLGGSGRQLRAQLLSPFVAQQLGTFIASENAPDLAALRELVESGAVTPAVDLAYPLGEVAAALRRLLAGQARGKVVISVSPPAPE